MRILLFLISLICTTFNLSGQTYYENSQFGIKIQEPTNWVLASNEDQIKNITKFKLTEEQLLKLIKDNKGIISLRTYYKYNIDSVSGLIPTIKINVRTNPTGNFTEFKKIMITSTDNIKTFVDDFKFIDNFTDIKLSEKDCLYYSCSYSLKRKDADKINVRMKNYMIPKGQYFISISLMDNQTDDDCSKLYDELISSLQLEE